MNAKRIGAAVLALALFGGLAWGAWWKATAERRRVETVGLLMFDVCVSNLPTGSPKHGSELDKCLDRFGDSLDAAKRQPLLAPWDWKW